MVSIIVKFIIFGFLGWIIDSIACSLSCKKIVISGYFRNIPISTIHGFGGLIILYTFDVMDSYNPILTIFVTSVLITFLEYIGGIFCEYFLNEKLWDYSNEFLNIDGHISLLHSTFWTLLIILMYIYKDFMYKISHVLDKKLFFTLNIEYLSGLFFIAALLLLSIINKNHRLKSKSKRKKLG